MRCKICNRELTNATTTLPFNNICRDCTNKYVTTIIVERSQDMINKEYQDSIDYSLNEIKKHIDRINLYLNNIEFFKSQIIR